MNKEEINKEMNIVTLTERLQILQIERAIDNMKPYIDEEDLRRCNNVKLEHDRIKYRMNDFLKSKLKEILGLDDFIHTDFKHLDTSVTKGKVDFRKSQGSVRLILRRIFLPSDTKTARERVLSRKTI